MDWKDLAVFKKLSRASDTRKKKEGEENGLQVGEGRVPRLVE